MTDTSNTVATDVIADEDFPEDAVRRAGNRSGPFADMLRPAITDRKARRSVLPEGVDMDAARKWATRLQHSANTLDVGVKSGIKEEDGRIVVYWQVRDKRTKVAESSAATPANDPAAAPSDPTPSQGGGGTRSKRK